MTLKLTKEMAGQVVVVVVAVVVIPAGAYNTANLVKWEVVQLIVWCIVSITMFCSGTQVLVAVS